MNNYVEICGLSIADELYSFVSDRLIADAPLSSETLWAGFSDIVRDLRPINDDLLRKRDELQTQIDEYLKAHKGKPFDTQAYRKFLYDIGYLSAEGPDFVIGTTDIDPEIAVLAGPQLVVPVSNARFALNAQNARWGSLYDALYGTDVIPFHNGYEAGGAYDSIRSEKVVEYVQDFLDSTLPLENASHSDVARYFVEEPRTDALLAFRAELKDERIVALRNPDHFKGYLGSIDNPTTLLFCHNGLHIEFQIDRAHRVGQSALSGMKDVLLEAALTVIQDLEDSVAAVDVADKIAAYCNWSGLLDGSLEARFAKGEKCVVRRPDQNRLYIGADRDSLALKGRSLLMIRNVGLLTQTDCVLDSDGKEIPEGFLDALITALCALPDIQNNGALQNSSHGKMYVVKPKLHGPEEVSLTAHLFERIEDLLGLERNTIGLGVMDEERRTSANLKECIRAAKDRIIFINTGFLDRTGDEIYTGMEAGPVLRKEQIKAEPWLQAYEKRNVSIGLACGFQGKAQIGKGMWPKPDEMAEMLRTKKTHLDAGANCAWVPSPTAAVLHALHYHQTLVADVQKTLSATPTPPVETLFEMPLLKGDPLSDAEIETELRNNLQSILGYVVRWIDQGVGCSTVPDMHNIGLMEDRATLRISAQHVANWLYHGVCSEAQIQNAFEDVAVIVDRQNAEDSQYQPMTTNLCENIAYQAALELVFEARAQPNGYTELILNRARRKAKALLN